MAVRLTQRMRSAAGHGDRASGFPPIVGTAPSALILGTLPSVASIEKDQYYGHPQNAFWKIMYALLAGRDDGDASVLEVAYAERTALLKRSGIAVWDVLGQSVRPGSMDADIDLSTAQPNPLAEFLESRSGIALVCFNGRKAGELFKRFVDTSALSRDVHYAALPSTSPAYAAMPLAEKTGRWRAALEGYVPAVQ